MKKFYRTMALSLAAALFSVSVASGAAITPSVAEITLPRGQTTFSFDVVLDADTAFAGAEFSLKPSSEEVKIDVESGIVFLEDVSAYGTVKAERDGAIYFGFFSGRNDCPAKEYKVATLTYTYSGSEEQRVTLTESNIVTLNSDGETTSSDRSSEGFEVKIMRETGGGSGGGSGGGGGGAVDAEVQNVIRLIKSIGNVTKDSQAAIESARSAYDKLTDSQKSKITNYKDLTDAEKAYNELLQEDLPEKPDETDNDNRDDGNTNVVSSENKYDDVKKEDWFSEAVYYVSEKGLMFGTGERTFEPDTTLNRAMLAAILYRMEGSPAVNGASPFADVAEGKWYTNPIKWASQNGIVGGYGDGNFGPSDNITREQMALMLMKYCEFKGINTESRAPLTDFSDGDRTSFWAKDAMSWAVYENIVSGRSGRILASADTATRAEAASLLMRFHKNILNR